MIELSDKNRRIIDAAIEAIVKRGVVPTTRGIREQIIEDQEGAGLSLQTIHPAYRVWHRSHERLILGLIDVAAINDYRAKGPVNDELARRTLSRLAERRIGAEKAAEVIAVLRSIGKEGKNNDHK
jgi:hypothetical protein